VVQKQPWLVAKINEQKALTTSAKLSFQQGAKLPFLGAQYVLHIECSQTESIYLDQHKGQIVVRLGKRRAKLLDNPTKLHDYVQGRYFHWLNQEACHYLPPLISELNVLTKLQHQHLVIKRYKARWGSCNNKGEISLNYLLMACPDWVIRYVVIHELCHLKHLNHSTQFWSLVAHFCPAFDTAKTWLKTQSFDIRN